MKIRAITVFTEVETNDAGTPLARAATFLHAATHAFQQAGIDVQTRRVATQPFPHMRHPRGPVGMPGLAAELHEQAAAYGIDYLALGPVSADDDPDYVDALPDMIRAASNVFASIDMTSRTRRIDLGLLRHAARVIHDISAITPDGLSNLYVAAIANCAPGSPFFPAAYHGGGPARFALAIEAADLVVSAFENGGSPEPAKQNLTNLINEAAARLTAVAQALAAEHDLAFGGLDFSLAPYPGETTSLGGGMERLGVTVGGAGMVGAASMVMNAIEAAAFPRCGFSGLMLPVLEDGILGRRVAEGTLRINDLLLYSAVCGTGLDCIPLPGDVETDVLAAILLDVAALSLRLDKPLTARLMPLPGRAAGDPVTFPDFEYFAPSRVIQPPPGLSAGAFGSDAILSVTPRPHA
jgi:uncharacterized protein (UPF0210 family)